MAGKLKKTITLQPCCYQGKKEERKGHHEIENSRKNALFLMPCEFQLPNQHPEDF
jgi:hypothetical protein